MYNATAISRDADGKVVSLQAVYVVDGKVLRAAGHWTYNVGKPAFHEDWERARMSFVDAVEIREDGGEAVLKGMMDGFDSID